MCVGGYLLWPCMQPHFTRIFDTCTPTFSLMMMRGRHCSFPHKQCKHFFVCPQSHSRDEWSRRKDEKTLIKWKKKSLVYKNKPPLLQTRHHCHVLFTHGLFIHSKCWRSTLPRWGCCCKTANHNVHCRWCYCCCRCRRSYLLDCYDAKEKETTRLHVALGLRQIQRCRFCIAMCQWSM